MLRISKDSRYLFEGQDKDKSSYCRQTEQREWELGLPIPRDPDSPLAVLYQLWWRREGGGGDRDGFRSA